MKQLLKPLLTAMFAASMLPAASCQKVSAPPSVFRFSSNQCVTPHILSELMSDSDYITFVETLKRQPESFVDIFRTGKVSGNDVVDVVSRPLPVSKLKATQNEIGLSDSLLFVLNPSKASGGKMLDSSSFILEILGATNNSVLKPLNIDIVVSGDNIIDGHHRWSTIALLNPSTQIGTLNITGSDNAVTALKATQAAILATKGIIPSSTKRGVNMLQMDESELYDFIKDNISEEVSKGLQQFWNTDASYVVRKLTEIVSQNLLNMKLNNVDRTNNIGRMYMPQTDNQGTWHQALSSGTVNVRYPFHGGRKRKTKSKSMKSRRRKTKKTKTNIKKSRRRTAKKIRR